MTISTIEVVVAISALLVLVNLAAAKAGYHFADYYKGARMTKKRELEDQIDQYEAELKLCKIEGIRLTGLIAQLKIDNINLKVNLCRLASACYRTAQDLGGLADIYKPEAK